MRVLMVHQIYGLFRDGRPMSDLFTASSLAWKTWCSKLSIPYIMWDADMVDTMFSTHASPDIMRLYKKVKYGVQRYDIARFLILYRYGGMYAELDTFPNRRTYPQVSLGLPKIASRAPCQDAEWEMEVVIATRGNDALLGIMANMAQNYKGISIKYPLTFIHQTTGKKALSRYLKTTDTAARTHIFAMNRPSEEFTVQHVFMADQDYSQAARVKTKLMETARVYDILTLHRGAVGGSLTAPPPIVVQDINVVLPVSPSLRTRRIVGKRPVHMETVDIKRRRVADDSEAAAFGVVANIRRSVTDEAEASPTTANAFQASLSAESDAVFQRGSAAESN